MTRLVRAEFPNLFVRGSAIISEAGIDRHIYLSSCAMTCVATPPQQEGEQSFGVYYMCTIHLIHHPDGPDLLILSLGQPDYQGALLVSKTSAVQDIGVWTSSTMQSDPLHLHKDDMAKASDTSVALMTLFSLCDFQEIMEKSAWKPWRRLS